MCLNTSVGNGIPFDRFTNGVPPVLQIRPHGHTPVAAGRIRESDG